MAAVAAGVALTGCATSHEAAAGGSGVPSQEPAVTPVVSAPTALRPVTMTLEFIAPSSDTVYSEDSGCARASLAFDGSQGPLLDAWLTDVIEQLLHVTFDINGSPSVASAS